jgi:hypothetical protein
MTQPPDDGDGPPQPQESSPAAPRGAGWWAATVGWAILTAIVLGSIFALGPYVLAFFGKETTRQARHDLAQLLSNHDSTLWLKVRFVIGAVLGALVCIWYRLSPESDK